MSEQVGWRSILKRLKNEVPQWGAILPTLPRKLDAFLTRDLNKLSMLDVEVAELKKQNQQQKQLIHLLTATIIGLAIFGAWLLKS
jgi:ubiquinone biosynthesis protein